MPGVPRSRGCRNCKRRKVKCSESWPTCRQCIQMGVKCPGPTPLVKFIYDGSHSSAKEDTESDLVVVEPSVSRVEDRDKSLRLQKMSYPNVNNGAAQYGLLRAALCRRNPTTLADRIGLRLVTSMERGPEGITNMYLSYLPELPQRLASSSCLRHSVDLFCAAWTDFRRRRPRGEVMGMPQYGKLLRSLRQALSGDQATTVETLAAITLLERTSRLFDWDRNADIHLKGVLQTFVKRGTPDVTDSLSVAVTNEIHALLLDNRPMGEENDFTRISPWKEAFDQCAENQSRVMDISPFIRSDIMIIYGFFKQLSQLSTDFRKISANPHTEEMISLRSVVSKQLQEMKISSRQIAIVSWEKGVEEGAIKETVDNNSITGSKIHFKSVRLFGLYQRMLLCQLIPLRMLYEISVISGSPDDAVFNEYREVGIEAQKMIPYLRSLESIVAIDLLDPIYLSYEAANDREREYILFSIEQINQHIDQLPKDRGELNHLVIESGKLIAGLETLAIAEDGGLALDTTNCAGAMKSHPANKISTEHTTSMALVQIPSEIRQIILDLAIRSPVAPPESPSVTQHDRARLNRNVFGGSAIWQRAPKNPALPLMLVNKQLNEEVQKVLQFVGTDYHVDIMYVKDRGLWTTWSIPALPKTQYIDSIHATFRIFDPPADLDKKFNNSLSFRGGDGGPPFAVWGFHSLLVEALRSGPGYLQPPEGENPSCRFAVKKIVVNILAPTDGAIHKSINRSDADFENKASYRTINVRRHDDVEKPPEDRLAEYMEDIFRTVWSMGYHSLNYGAVILEGVRDSIDFLVNGQLQTRFDLEKRVEVMESNKPYWGETPELVQRRKQRYAIWMTWLKERRKKMEEGLEFDIERPVGDII